jgi:hypothetical protein
MIRALHLIAITLLLAVTSCSNGTALRDLTGIPQGAEARTIAISYATDPENAIFDFIDAPMERKQLLPSARFLNRREKIPTGTPVIFDRLLEARSSAGDPLIHGHLFFGGKRIPVVIRSSDLPALFGIHRRPA